MLFDDLLDQREADAGAGVLLTAVEPFEHAEDPLPVLGVDPDAVVGHGEPPLPAGPLRGDRDPRDGAGRVNFTALLIRF